MLHQRLPGISETAQDLCRRRCHARADPGAADRALQHGRHPDQLSRRGAATRPTSDPDARRAGPDGGRRGGLRLGARRQPARLQFAARHRRLRPRRGDARGRDWCEPGAPHAPLPRRRRRGGDRPARPRAPRQGRRARPPTIRRRRCSARCRTIAPSSAPPRCSREGVEQDRPWSRTALPISRITDRSMIWNSDLVEALELDEPARSRRSVALHSGREPHREPRRARARGLPAARRRELAASTPSLGSTARAGASSATARSTSIPLSNEVQTFPPKARVY